MASNKPTGPKKRVAANKAAATSNLGPPSALSLSADVAGAGRQPPALCGRFVPPNPPGGSPPPYPGEGPWDRRVLFGSGKTGHFAYRPAEIVIRTADFAAVNQLLGGGLVSIVAVGPMMLVGNVANPISESALLRLRGYPAQVNHVFFADVSHGQPGSTFGTPSPIGVSPIGVSPIGVSPIGVSPIGVSPIGVSPIGVSPIGVSAGHGASGWPTTCCDDPCRGIASNRGRAQRRTLAQPAGRPASQQDVQPPERGGVGGNPVAVVIIDTGFCQSQDPTLKQVYAAPVTAADKVAVATAKSAPGTIAVRARQADWDIADADGDDHYDPYSGHGTFIAGIIGNVAPSADVVVQHGMRTHGDIDDIELAVMIELALHRLGRPVTYQGNEPQDLIDLKHHPLILSLSFSGYTEHDEAPIATEALITQTLRREARP